jgi:hypothetical protein
MSLNQNFCNYRQRKLDGLTKFECEKCKKELIKDKVRVHHVDKNRKNCHINNLIIVCTTCHNFLHKDDPKRPRQKMPLKVHKYSLLELIEHLKIKVH